MKKNPFPLVAAAVLSALLAGTAGYIAGERNTPSRESLRQKNAAAHNALRVAPNREKTEQPAEKKTGSNFKTCELDSLLDRYSLMTPKQLEQEIDLWQKENFSGFADYSRDNEAKKIALYSLCYNWGKSAPKQALARLEAMGNSSNYFGPAIIQGWAERSPEAAAAYFKEHQGTLPHVPQTLRNIAREMGRAAPETALKWAKGLDENERLLIRFDLVTGIGDAHPQQLAKYISTLSPEEIKSELPLLPIGRWAEAAPEAASHWIETLDSPDQELARLKILKTLSSLDPEKATQEFHKLDAKAQSAAADYITSGIASKDHVRALQWLAENAPERDDAETIGGIIIGGAFTNETSELKKYVTGMQDSPVKDTSLECLIKQNMLKFREDFVNFEETAALANGIKNEEKREKSLNAAFQEWIRWDAEKAKLWLESSSLPEKTKKEYLEPYERFLRDAYPNGKL